MADEIDWALTTWEGSRRRQHLEFLAIPFREKLERLEEMERVAALLRRAPPPPQAGD